jgi:hypothetical protein
LLQTSASCLKPRIRRFTVAHTLEWLRKHSVYRSLCVEQSQGPNARLRGRVFSCTQKEFQRAFDLLILMPIDPRDSASALCEPRAALFPETQEHRIGSLSRVGRARRKPSAFLSFLSGQRPVNAYRKCPVIHNIAASHNILPPRHFRSTLTTMHPSGAGCIHFARRQAKSSRQRKALLSLRTGPTVHRIEPH